MKPQPARWEVARSTPHPEPPASASRVMLACPAVLIQCRRPHPKQTAPRSRLVHCWRLAVPRIHPRPKKHVPATRLRHPPAVSRAALVPARSRRSGANSPKSRPKKILVVTPTTINTKRATKTFISRRHRGVQHPPHKHNRAHPHRWSVEIGLRVHVFASSYIGPGAGH